MKSKDPYKGMPWNSLDQYYTLGKLHNAWGNDLKAKLKEESKRKGNLIPHLKLPR